MNLTILERIAITEHLDKIASEVERTYPRIALAIDKAADALDGGSQALSKLQVPSGDIPKTEDAAIDMFMNLIQPGQFEKTASLKKFTMLAAVLMGLMNSGAVKANEGQAALDSLAKGNPTEAVDTIVKVPKIKKEMIRARVTKAEVLGIISGQVRPKERLMGDYTPDYRKQFMEETYPNSWS